MIPDWVWKFFSVVGFVSPVLAFAFRNWISERIKIGFQKELEIFKVSLDSQKEAFRVQLARETEQLTLHKNSITEIYPQFFEKLMIASGNVCGLVGGKWAADYSKWSKAQIEDHLVFLKTPTDRASETLALFESDKSKLAKELGHFDRQDQILKARSS